MGSLTLNPKKPPRLSQQERERLLAMSDADIESAARSDADNPPLTKDELLLIKAARLVRNTRELTGLPQREFAAKYHINLGRLRDFEQARSKPDSAVEAYIRVIAKDPDFVAQAVEG